MPINTTCLFVKGVIEAVQPPGLPGANGPLATYIAPPDPDESGGARCYVWPASGREKRRAMPRNTGTITSGAWKDENHTVIVWPLWFDDLDHDPDADTSFPSLVDALMDALRTCVDPVEGFQATDPYTGRVSHLMNVGEEMSYDITTFRSTADQRIVVCQAAIRVPVLELIQA